MELPPSAAGLRLLVGMASFGPPPAERARVAGAAAWPAARWRRAKDGDVAANTVGAWQRVVAQTNGEEERARRAPSPPALSPATVRFQSRLKEAEQIIVALREQTQLLQVQLDNSRGEAADASLRLELVLAEAAKRGVDLGSWLTEQVADAGAIPFAEPSPPPSLEPTTTPTSVARSAPVPLSAATSLSPPKNRDSSHHTTPGWGMLRANLAEKPVRRVPAMATVVDSAAFPQERLKAEAGKF